MTGYIIMAVFAIVCLSVSSFVAKRYSGGGVDDFVAAGRSIPFGLVTASVMVSWVWTITIIGSAEAGFNYGVSGGMNYAWGAAIPFFVFIPLVLTLRRKMPKCTTFVEFIKARYGSKVSQIFIVFALALTFYILLSQGVGMGVVFSTLFHMPYKFAAAVPLIIIAMYTAKAGLRGSIVNDVIMFFVIALIFIITVPLVLKTLGMETIYNGLKDVATNVSNVNHNKDALNMLSGTGFRYGIVSMVVCMGQVLLDQGYYSKAVATVSKKSLLVSYIIGTVVAWLPIPIISGVVYGGAALGVGASVGGGQLATTSDVAPYIMQLVFGGGIGSIMFALMIFMTGLTTGGDILSGAQAICTVDIYKKYVNKNATEKEQTRFGRRMTIVIGLIMAVVVMYLEGKSILSLDIFSGIIFAAPCAAFIAGLIWDKVSNKVAVASIFIGLATGMIAYFVIPDDNINYFVGNVCSLCVPILVIMIGSFFTKERFDFDILKKYEPDHLVNVVED
ncbi:MAG: hypothetical protein PHD70_00925 [Anaerostipes sp.]|jgi:Na+/proline symporter|nr:hypothetical protein [Anaerostipes sp.]MDD3745017.1 hypothetical protein [Anaerostipes sp.]